MTILQVWGTLTCKHESDRGRLNSEKNDKTYVFSVFLITTRVLKSQLNELVCKRSENNCKVKEGISISLCKVHFRSM